MTTTKKLVITVVALSLALVCVIGGTLAFLVATSDKVTNTFTYGEITLELWENELNEDGSLSTSKTTTGLKYENIVPGDIANKNPTVTVTEGSEKCYVYVLIDNQLGDAASYDIAATWTKVGENGTEVLYRYNNIVDAKESDQDLAVFTTLTFAKTLTKENVAALADKDVVLTAYAHQSDNTTVDVANAAAIKWANVTAGTNS